MYQEWLFNIVEESFEALENSDRDNRTEEQKALARINGWAIELYDHHQREKWYGSALKEVNRLAGSWGNLDLEEQWAKQCPCGAWDNDRWLNDSYMTRSEWIEKHYPHDKNFQEELKSVEERLGKERKKRRIVDKLKK